jgi:hypothetical protein
MELRVKKVRLEAALTPLLRTLARRAGSRHSDRLVSEDRRPGAARLWLSISIVHRGGVILRNARGGDLRFPGLKIETWGTPSFVDGLT